MSPPPGSATRRASLPAVAFLIGLSAPARGESAPAPPTAPPAAIALRAEATRLFRAKSYASACPKFEELVKLVPDDADAIGDLALCKQRVGDKEAARGLNRRAIELASRSGRIDDVAAARTRRHAYFNLAQLDPVDPAPGGAREQECGELDRPPSCSKSLFACGVTREDGWKWRLVGSETTSIARDAKAARIDDGSLGGEPDYAELRTPFSPTPVVVGSSDQLVFLSAFQEEARGDLDCEPWSCDTSDAVRAEIDKCIASPGPPAAPAAKAKLCQKQVCDRAARRPGRAVAQEQAAARRAARDCRGDSPAYNGQYGCAIVYSNACSGLVGIVCSGHASGAKTTRTRVEEYRFE